MKHALVICHSSCESLASNFTKVLQERGFQLETSNIFEHAPQFEHFYSPQLDDISLILVLGGPFSANDDYPALKKEQTYLKEAIDLGIPVFGVCLGAQLMSAALGGLVKPTGGYQFGLRKIDITAEGAVDPVFNKIVIPLVATLHGECFSVPKGATKLAEGYMLCRDGLYKRINMAFRYNNCYGFQFEPQLTLEELEIWNQEMVGDYKLMGEPFDPLQEAERSLREFAAYAPLYEEQMKNMLLAFLVHSGLGYM